MSPAERFAVLLTAVVAVIGLAGTALGVLVRMSGRIGQLLERFEGHVKVSDAVDKDHEQRLRGLEHDRRRRA